MTTTFQENAFEDSVIDLSGHVWIGNRFRRCRLIAETPPAVWEGNVLEECEIELRGPMAAAAQFLSGLIPITRGNANH